MKSWIHYILGKINIPHELLKNQSPKYIHLSDTPSEIYKSILILIHTIKPQFIFHTGDIADNIKLELYPNQTERYDEALMQFSKGLETRYHEKIFFCMGNHDSSEIVKKNFPKSTVFTEYGRIKTPIGNFYLSHQYSVDNQHHAEYILYGHDLAHLSNMENKFNGIEFIYIFQSCPFKVYAIPYPIGTDSFRQKKMHLGI